MIRAQVYRTFFTLVIAATYLWGGCVSCEQLFASKQPSTHCCQHDKCQRHSEQPSPGNAQPDCDRTAVVESRAPDTPIQIADAAHHAPAQPLAAPPLRLFRPPDPLVVSTPGLPVLHSSLLI
jgi:hypothetical protein